MSATTLLKDLPKIRVPVPNIIGAEDAIVPPAQQLRLSKLLPHVQTVLLRRCGHLPMVEHQATAAGIICAFIDGLTTIEDAKRRNVRVPIGGATN